MMASAMDRVIRVSSVKRQRGVKNSKPLPGAGLLSNCEPTMSPIIAPCILFPFNELILLEQLLES